MINVSEEKMRVYNKTLDPNLWNEQMQLDPQVRKTLLQIAEDFYDSTDLQGGIIDVFLIGSSANYNWTPQSDCDLHIIIDISKEKINPKYARKFMDSLNQSWNSIHELEVKGHPVEVYLQDQTEPNGSPETFRPKVAIFSLKNNQWVQRPQRETLELDKEGIKRKYREIKARIEKLISDEDYSGLKSLMKKIKNYRSAGLKAGGEFSTENLVFKALRHTGMLEKLKTNIQTIYDKKTSLDETADGRPFIVTGTTAQDLEVAGERYYEGDKMVTHGQIRSKYGNWSGSEDWRYRSDINVLFWWGLPDEEEREATRDWLARKFNVRNPREVNAKETSDRIKDLVHYPWMKGRVRENTQQEQFYVVGIVTNDLNIIAKKYTSRENYITHDQLYKQYGLDFGTGKGWRYHAIGNWIFWWDNPSEEQKQEVRDYLRKKYGIVTPKDETGDTLSKNRLREVMAKKDYLLVGFVNKDLEVFAKKDYGKGDAIGSHTVQHGDFDREMRGRFNYDSPFSHWRYKSSNNTLYWWVGDEMTQQMLDVVLDYLHTKWNVRNPKLDRNKEHYFDDAHFITEIICEAGKRDYIYYGNIDDYLNVNAVHGLPSNDERQGNHHGEGKRWRHRTTLPYLFWWEPPNDEEKDAVEFYLYKKFGIKVHQHKNFRDLPFNLGAVEYLHGVDKVKKPKFEGKFNPFEAKELQFVTYGGLSLTKQKGFKNEPGVSFHGPPARKGIYAFVWPYVEKFLLGGYYDPKERGKGQRNRIAYVKDKEGNPITSDHPDFEKLSDIPKNWSLQRKRDDAPGHKPGSDEFEWDKEYYSILFRNTPRKKFSYNGPIWHHLKERVKQHEILDEKGDWVKTDMEAYHRAFLREIQMMKAYKTKHGIGFTLDHLEVFIDQKI